MRPDIVIPVRGGRICVELPQTIEDMYQRVGDRLVLSPIQLQLREKEAPAIDITIAVINHVPRVVGVNVSRHLDGREVRKKDLDLDLDGLVEQAIALVSIPDDGQQHVLPRAFGGADADVTEIRAGIRAVANARKRSQRVMSTERLTRVAEIYLAQESGGLEAVAAAYNVHRATAARWIAKAREAGLLAPREGDGS